MMLLVSADVLQPRRVDAHFGAEAEAAKAAGLEVALIDHDALTSDRRTQHAVAHVPGGGSAVYRGWMLRSEQYAAFATALAERWVRLVTTAEQYRRAHELPDWHPALANLTPRSEWTVGTDRGEFEAACTRLGKGAAVLRDYCKSMKHYWSEAAFIPDLADASAARAVATRFRTLREEDFVGGFVLRRFEAFTDAEVRTRWINGKCQLITAHPDTPDAVPQAIDEADLASVAAAVAGLDLPFVSVDLARRADGVWRVIELGDGQVSDRPVSTPPHGDLNSVRHLINGDVRDRHVVVPDAGGQVECAVHGAADVRAGGEHPMPDPDRHPAGPDLGQQVQVRLILGEDHGPGGQRSDALTDLGADGVVVGVALGDQPRPPPGGLLTDAPVGGVQADAGAPERPHDPGGGPRLRRSQQRPDAFAQMRSPRRGLPSRGRPRRGRSGSPARRRADGG